MRNVIKILNIDFLISGTSITLPFSAICSITNKRFRGEIIIEYHPYEKVVEYVSVERALSAMVKEKLTVEKLAFNMFDIIKKSIHPKYLKVLVDVQKSEAHSPVRVWIEKEFRK